MSLPGPESFRKLDTATPPNSARSGSIDMQLQKPKLPGKLSKWRNRVILDQICCPESLVPYTVENRLLLLLLWPYWIWDWDPYFFLEDSVELDIHSETDSAREFSSGLRSEGDEGGHKHHSYLGHNATIDLGGHVRHFQSSSGGKTSAKTASQPHLPHANASSAYNSADSDLGKPAGKCFDCHFAGHSSMQTIPSSLPPPQPPSRRNPPQNNNNNNNNNNNVTSGGATGNGEPVDRSRLHVRGGSRCSAQSSIDTDQGSVSTTGRESTTAADEEEELEGEEEEEEEDFDGSVEVPAPNLPPPPPLQQLQASDLGTPVDSKKVEVNATRRLEQFRASYCLLVFSFFSSFCRFSRFFSIRRPRTVIPKFTECFLKEQ